MKPSAAIGILCGVLIGAGAMYFVTRRAGVPATGGLAGAPSAAPGVMAGNSLVGMWKLDIPPITAIYDFKDDGTFSLRFKGASVPPVGRATAHEAFGTWSVDNKTLVMRNTTSTTPFTLIGEETATIVSTSPTALMLLNVDHKGRNETLAFTRVEPFVKGRRDKPAIVGIWQVPQSGGMELKEDGELLMVSGSRNSPSRSGEWSQEKNTLRLRIHPLPVPDTARRAWSASMYDTREMTYQIVDLASDGQALTVRLTDPQTTGAAAVTYSRSTAPLRADPPLPRQRP